MLHGWKRIVVAVLTALLLFNASPIPAMASVLSNAPAENEQILSELGSIAGSEDEAERYYELMERYGLLDEGGNPVESWTIQMDGKDVTLDEIRETLAGDYDAEKTVTVDGTTVTLGDLNTMLQIEDYVAHIKDAYFSGQEWTDEQKASLESLESQINNEGIEIEGKNGELVYPSGVDHNLRLTVEAADTAENGQDYTVTVSTADGKPVKKEVTFDYTALSGSVAAEGSGTAVIPVDQSSTTVTVTVGSAVGRTNGDSVFVLSLYNVKNALFEGGTTAWNKTVKVAQDERFVYTGETQQFTLSYGGEVYETGAYTGVFDDDGPIISTFGNSALAGSYGEMAERVTTDVSVPGLSAGTYQVAVTMSNIRFERLNGATSKDDLPDYHNQIDLKDEFPIWNFHKAIDGQIYEGNLQEDYNWNLSNGSFSFYLNGSQFGLNQLPTLNAYTANGAFASSVSGSGTGTESTVYRVGLGLSRSYYDSRYSISPGWDNALELRKLYMLPKMEATGILRVQEVTEKASASLSAPAGDYVPGQQIPITVSFGIPMEISKDMELTFGMGDAKQTLTPVEVGSTSDRATFLYTVQSIDGASLDFRSAELNGRGANGRDITVSLPDQTEINDALAGAQLVTPAKRDAIEGFSATIENPLASPVLNISIPVSDNEKLTNWLTSELSDEANVDQEAGVARTSTLMVSIDGTTMVPLTAPLERGQDEPLTLTAQIALPLNTTDAPKTYVPELYIDGNVVLDLTQTVDLEPAVFITGEDISPSISVKDAEGKDYAFADDTYTIYAQDAPKIKASIGLSDAKTFSFGDTSNTTTFTVNGEGGREFANPDADFAWGSTAPDVAAIDKDGNITPTGKSGESSFELVALNGRVEVDGVSQMVAKTATYTFTPEGGEQQTQQTLKFGAGLTPFLLIPNKSLTAVDGQDVTVYWSSNLCDKSGDTPTEFTVTVRGDDDKTVEVPAGAEGVSNPMTVTGTASAPAASVTIPSALLQYSYEEGASNSFTVEVKASYENKDYIATATISLASQPAVVNLASLPSYYILDTQGAQQLSWTIEHFDRAADDNQDDVFKFQLLKNDEEVETGAIELTRDGGTAQGGYTINLGDVQANPSDPTSYRDVYTVTVQAKNGSDSTWSYDSFVLYVYDAEALQIMVDGAKAGDVLTMSNVEKISKDANTAEWQHDILALNRDISLKNAISINYGEYAWQELSDQIAWASSNSAVASVNYQQGTLYENIENFTYTSYRPTEDFVLSGLSDGEVSVTATHKLTGMQDLLDVKVETLTNKLYLFQCYPQVATTLSFDIYTDAARSATKHVEITSEDDGRAAYYAEFGIAGDVYCTSTGKDGNTYLGTFYQSDLKTGEQDATKLELYPVNNLQMRRAAYAYVYLKNPDGTPYRGSVIFRGGVYVNGEYVESALFKLNGTGDVTTPGNQDTTVDLSNTDGKLEVTMDQTQWGLESGAVVGGDDVRYVFQLERGDNKEYYPLLVTIDAMANEHAVVGTGETVVNFRENVSDANGAYSEHPFIIGAVESFSNYGTPMSVLDYTGKVGPSDSLPEAALTLVSAWWGDEKAEDPAAAPNALTLKTSDGIAVADGQGESSISHEAYPFSDMLLTTYTVRLNSSTMNGVLDAGGRTEIKLEYSKDGTEVSRTETLPFQLCNMLSLGEVTELDTVSNLVQNLGGYAGTSASDTPTNMGMGDEFVGVLLSLVADDDYTTGGDKLFSIQLAPTEDPTKFLGFIEVNIGNMSDKDQVTGVYAQPGQTQDFDYTPGLSEVMTLTGLRTPQRYALGQLNEFNKSMQGRGVHNTSFDLGGYAESLIYFNNDTGKWSIQILNGGFNAGGGMSYTWNYNTFCGPIPFTASLTAGGSAEVSMDALTVGYLNVSQAEYDFGNDFLTQLRIYMYLRFFAGVGFDYSIVAFKLGVFGQVNLDMRFRWLNRPYMDSHDRIINAADARANRDENGVELDYNLNGQNFAIDGQVGLEFIMKLLFISYEKVLFSFNFNLFDESTGQWTEIQNSWEANSAAQRKAIEDLLGNGSATLSDAGGQQMVSLNLAPTVESRDYLSQGGRTWNGGGIQLFSLDEENGLKDLETNAYPYANPVVTDDGELLAYVTDQDSTDAEDTRAAWAEKSGTSYAKKEVLPAPQGEDDGYGDSQLSLDGVKGGAVAAWTRQTVSLDKDENPDTGEVTLTDADQMMMMNGTDVYASVWNGTQWATTRLSKNDSPDMAPVVATNGKTGEGLRAVVAWRSVQSSGPEVNADGTTMANPTDFDMKDTIVYKVYDGKKWSDEAKVLYNGTSGAVKGIVAAMLDDGTAAVAYALDRDGSEATATDREIAYGVIDTKGEVTRSVIATNDAYLDENPQLTAVTFPNAEGKGVQRFVLGWYSEQGVATDDAQVLDGGAGETQDESTGDIRLVDFDAQGAVTQLLPDSLGDVTADTDVSVTSNFRFAKNASSIDDLSILWTERAGGSLQAAADEGEDVDAAVEHDVLKGVKFYTYGANNELVRTTGAIDVAEMGEGTLIDHFDAYVSDAGTNTVKAVMLGTTYGEGGKTVTRTAETVAGDIVSFTVPESRSGMYTATESYADGIEVPNFVADYDTVRLGATTQLQFMVTNKGIHAIDKLEFKVGDTTTTYGDDCDESEINLLPGQSIQLAADYQVPDNGVVDPEFTVTAHFSDEGSTGEAGGSDEGVVGLVARAFNGEAAYNEAKGTVYLDLPDVEITDAAVVSEENGKRTIQVKLNNHADASLANSGSSAGRSVRLGFYSDATCETPLAAKYFSSGDVQGSGDDGYAVTIDDQSGLAMIDDGGYAVQVTFDAARFAKDAKGEDAAEVEEIPDTGIPVYIKAEVWEDQADGKAVELGEPTPSDNYASVTAENLAVRTGEEVSINSAMTADESGTTVTVDLQNNRLAQKTTGNLIVTLLDENGNVIAQQQSYKPGTSESGDNGFITLGGEEAAAQTFAFSGVTNAAQVRVTYSDAVLDQNNAELASVEVDGVALTYDDATKTWSGSGDSLPQSLVTIVAKNPGATVTVNGQPYNGSYLQAFGSGENRFEIVVTAPDGTTTATYYLAVGNNVPYVPPSYGITVSDEVEHGSVKVSPSRATTGQTVTITPTPDEGYLVGGVTVTDAEGNEVAVTDKGDGTFTFTMPRGEVTVEVRFTCDGGELCPSRHLVDVPVGTWYHDVVDWAVSTGLMGGYDDGSNTFGPDDTLTRAQLAQMMYNEAGKPETDAADAERFSDCGRGMWYAKAVAWASEQGFMLGYDDGSGRFGPDDELTREQLAVVFWRIADEPSDEADLSQFPDGDITSVWAREAVKWAVATELLRGYDNTGELGPGDDLTRAQAAAVFMRQAEAKEDTEAKE